MPINSDKPHLWKADVTASVDLYNTWFLSAAPAAFKNSRARSTERAKAAFAETDDLQSITIGTLERSPSALSVLRMCTAPPIARDRLIGLAGAIVKRMEEGFLPTRISQDVRTQDLARICEVLARLIDKDFFFLVR